MATRAPPLPFHLLLKADNVARVAAHVATEAVNDVAPCVPAPMAKGRILAMAAEIIRPKLASVFSVNDSCSCSCCCCCAVALFAL